MARTGTQQMDTALRALRARIDQWRQTRAKRAAMPDDLWAGAVALCEEQGLYSVSQGLKLSYDRLKLRVVEAELERVRAQVTPEPADHKHLPDVATAGFVELCTAEMFDVASGTIVEEVELWRADGARMTLRMASDQALDLVGLSQTFFGGGQ